MKPTKLLLLRLDLAFEFTFEIARTCDFSVRHLFTAVKAPTNFFYGSHQTKVGGLTPKPNPQQKEL